MPKVEDIMTRNVMTVAPNTPVDDLAWGLTQKGVSGAPVQDAGGHLLGLVTKSDLADPNRPNKLHAATVEDVMSPFVFAVNASDSVLDAAKRMVDTGSHRLVVVDSSGHLAGIVSTMDVVRALVAGKLGGS
ncbi:MAG: CBS domain-containing protein [Polyangiaceae bacterium]|nr:CBS domain-containing protein [Polyangiaceae bacterium]